MAIIDNQIVVMSRSDLDDLLSNNVSSMVDNLINWREKLEGVPPYLSQASVAKFFDVSAATVSGWVKDKRIRVEYIEGSTRIPRSELKEMIKVRFNK